MNRTKFCRYVYLKTVQLQFFMNCFWPWRNENIFWKIYSDFSKKNFPLQTNNTIMHERLYVQNSEGFDFCSVVIISIENFFTSNICRFQIDRHLCCIIYVNVTSTGTRIRPFISGAKTFCWIHFRRFVMRTL